MGKTPAHQFGAAAAPQPSPIKVSAFSALSPFAAAAAVAAPPPPCSTTTAFFDSTAASAAAAAAATSAAVRASETVTAEAAALLARSRSTPGSLSGFFGGCGEATMSSLPRSASLAAPPLPSLALPRDPLSVLRSAAATPHDPSPLEHLTRRLEIKNTASGGEPPEGASEELEVPPPLALASVAAAAIAAQPRLSSLVFAALAALAGSNAAGVAAASDFERRTREATARASAASVPALPPPAPAPAPTAAAAPPPPAFDALASTGKKRRVTLSPPYDPELLLLYASAGVQVTLATAATAAKADGGQEEEAAGTPTSRLAAAAAAAAAAAEEVEDESPGGEDIAGIRVVGPTELRPHPTALPRIITAVRAASMPSLTSLLPAAQAQAPAVAS